MKQFSPADYTKVIILNAIQAVKGSTAYLVNTTTRDALANSLNDSFCLLSFSGEKLVEKQGSSAQASPDGKKIAFEKEGGLYVYDLDTGTDFRVADVFSPDYFMGHMADTGFAWSPDSSSIAYISSDQISSNQSPSIFETERLLYKTKGGRGREKFVHDMPVHIWLVQVANPKPVCLTPGNFNEHSLSWSPDGKSILFISDRSGNADRNHRNDMLKVDVASGAITTLVQGKGTRFRPLWSPDGNRIAFLADESSFTSKDSPAPDVHVYTISSSGANFRRIPGFPDRRADNIKWNAAGDKIYFLLGDNGRTELHAANIKSQLIEPVVQGNFLIKDFCVDENERVGFIRNSTNHPDEIFTVTVREKDYTKISSFNAKAASSFQFTDAETFWFNSTNDTKVQGWILRPFNYKEGGTFPLILVMHGGPHNMFGYEFDDRMQMLSSAGFGIVFFNPRGSTGYGQHFTNGNLNNWGGNDYNDIMRGMEHVMNEYKWIDKQKLGVTGQSYGGFLTNWIITQTNLFKAAVSDGGLSNLVSFAGTSLYHCLMEAEFGGDTWDNYDELWKWSPLRYVKNVTTPTLFLHGEADNEVPVTQAEEMYSALKRLGIETKFVRYLQEGHGWRPDMLPANRIDLMTRMIDWFNKYFN